MAPDWISRLNGDPLPWLLASDDAALRYRVLVDLLDRPADDPEVREARAGIAGSPIVSDILGAQHPEGYWAEPESTYRPKYRATHWQMILLAELGLDAGHPAVQLGLQRMAGAIAEIGAEDAVAQGNVLWCYSGNTLRYLGRLGLGAGEAASHAAERLIELAGRDPLWTCEHSDGQTCAWGAVKALRGLAALPEEARPAGTQQVIESAADLLLSLDYEAASAGAGTTENGWETDWLKFGFPSFYESDLLEALDALAEAGYGRHPAYRRLLPLVLEKQDGQGRWVLENSFNGRMHADVDVKGLPSRWLTLRALRVLKAVHGGA
ncbi:MAG: hypothetical protein K6V36_12310 [Anaerolineae bacterium]|nr:hypothetical protein [Anaerolineae bacterium]